MISPEVLIARSSDPAPSESEAQYLIDFATDYLERETGWHFGEPTGFVAVLSGEGGRNLWLRAHPADDSVSVTEATFTGSDPEEVEDWVVRANRLVRVAPALWYHGYEYEVTYTAGWEVDTGPASLREAVIQLGLAIWQDTHREAGVGVVSERIGDYSYQLGGGPGSDLASVASRVPLVREVINRWMRRVI